MRVLKRFMTPRRVFEPGTELDPTALDGPIPLAHWQAQGFVEGAPEAPPETPLERAEDAECGPTIPAPRPPQPPGP